MGKACVWDQTFIHVLAHFFTPQSFITYAWSIRDPKDPKQRQRLTSTIQLIDKGRKKDKFSAVWWVLRSSSGSQVQLLLQWGLSVLRPEGPRGAGGWGKGCVVLPSRRDAKGRCFKVSEPRRPGNPKCLSTTRAKVSCVRCGEGVGLPRTRPE